MTKLFNNDQYHVSFKPFLFGGGVHRFQFPNGYIGSVARHYGTYGAEEGLWEVAVMYDGKIVYDTPITNDVLGFLTEADVEQVLNQIRELPERKAT